nr:uncharacterized protein LOC105732381 [Aotus nancymaae]
MDLQWPMKSGESSPILYFHFLAGNSYMKFNQSTKAKNIFTGPQKMNSNLLPLNALSTVWKMCKGNGTAFSISNPSKCCQNKRISTKSPREIYLSVWYDND